MTDDSLAPSEPKRKSTRRRPSVRKAGRWIGLGATVTTLGLAMSLTDNRDFGGFITLCGLSACILGLHRYGRSGKPPPLA